MKNGEKKTAMPYGLHDEPIPRLDTIRRVPTRFHQILPLELMKRYQFIVVGAARGVLTVAISDIQQEPLIDSLKNLTGKPIFTVLIEPSRMRMMIDRIERCQYRRKMKLLGHPYYLHRVQLRAIMLYVLKAS